MSLPMELSKVALSDAEWQMAAVPDFILTKNRVIDAVYDVFGELADDYRNVFARSASGHPELAVWSPKISRGEKYEDMPWVVLDYPRCFSDTEGHFAIRSFFWWGHYFSIQLHISGKYLHEFGPVLSALQARGWYAGYTTEPWNNQLPNAGWAKLDGGQPLSPTVIFGKAAKKMPILEWASTKRFYEENYRELNAALFPGT
jgi:hypothetical protein